MDFFSAMEILASGLGAERVRMNLSAANLANAATTRTPQGGPYRRVDPVFEAQPANSMTFNGALDEALRQVTVPAVVEDTRPPREVHDPSHPDADARGYVQMPNVNMVEESVNMITAARAYEANVTALRSVIDMAERTLQLGR